MMGIKDWFIRSIEDWKHVIQSGLPEWMLTIGRFLIGYAFKWLFWNNLRKFQF